MKKYICILAATALFTACEQRTETVTPAAPADKTEHNTTIVNPSPAGGSSSSSSSSTTTTAPSPGTTTESSTSTTTSSPSDR